MANAFAAPGPNSRFKEAGARPAGFWIGVWHGVNWITIMRNVKLGTNVTIFLLFFGISLLDALRSHDWLRATLWFALGVVFLRADGLRRP